MFKKIQQKPRKNLYKELLKLEEFENKSLDFYEFKDLLLLFRDKGYECGKIGFNLGGITQWKKLDLDTLTYKEKGFTQSIFLNDIEMQFNNTLISKTYFRWYNEREINFYLQNNVEIPSSVEIEINLLLERKEYFDN